MPVADSTKAPEKLHPDLHLFKVNAIQEFNKYVRTLQHDEPVRGFVPVLASEALSRTAAELKRDIKQQQRRLPVHLQGMVGNLAGLRKEHLEMLWLKLDHLLKETEDHEAAALAEAEGDQADEQVGDGDL